jgi:ABC-2 type transport system permease protein
VAVYKRAYRPFEGSLTPSRSRFLVLTRYALAELAASRPVLAFVLLAFVPFLVEAAIVYVVNTPAALAVLNLRQEALPMTRWFFVTTLTIQGTLAFLLTAWVSPVLVSPDLVNGALPLYLSRPFSRAEYVLGKTAALFSLLSLITWVPNLLLFGIQAGLDGTWLRSELRVAWAILAGSFIWISVLTLLGLAISAWVRWRLVASALLFAVFFVGSGFGEMWREVLRNPWGRLANLSYMIGIVWRWLFDLQMKRPLAREMLDDRRAADIPAWAAWAVLLAVCGLSLWLLNRRLVAREVVR